MRKRTPQVSASPSGATVASLLLERVAATPQAEAFRIPTPSGWRTIPWQEVGARVRALSAGLRTLGLAAEERCAIQSGTRLEWILADLAILCAGGATTTVYPTTLAEEVQYIVSDAEAVVVFAEDERQLAKLASHRAELPRLRHVIVFEGSPSPDGWVIPLAELEARGRAEDAARPERFEELAGAVRPSSLATLIYTSGTTGRPKGVELTHDCWVFEAEGIDALGLLREDDVQYLWLPLAHAFGKVLEVAQLRIGFATAIDGRVERMVENLAVIRPTFVCAVPRVFEKVHNKIVAAAQQGGAVQATLFRWALRIGDRVARLTREGRSPGPLLALEHALADRLVLSRVRARFGGRLRFFISGAAALSQEVAAFFHATGILVCEGYGLTESSAASCVNRPDRFRFGTVGLPLPGVEVRIAPTDGEVLLRGRGLMRGYHRLAEATREALDPEGWLHTGDVGHLEEGGFLRITDRKKDLIKTSGGKYVAPQLVEGKLKALCPYVSQILVHGNDRSHCTALIALDAEAMRPWAVEHGLADRSYAQLAAEPRVRELIQGYLDQLNQRLAPHQAIRGFALLPEDLGTETGELTASLKVRRKVVEDRYRALLEALYPPSGRPH